jgi:hypothetical protein
MSENVDAAPDDQRISIQVLSGEHPILVSVFRDRGDELSLGDRSF